MNDQDQTEAPALICAWCKPQRVIREGALPASHVMCGDCQAKIDRELSRLEEAKRS